MLFASRRRFLRSASGACLALPVALLYDGAASAAAAPHRFGESGGAAQSWIDVRKLGAVGDGKTIDSNAINKAIDQAAERGGGVVHFPAGTYACYTIRLKSCVALHLDPGATILAASVPLEGTTTGGYDAAEPQGAWEPYQDYGHNHWRNSLI